jgi:hypothetical protein
MTAMRRRETSAAGTSVLTFPRLVEDPLETDALSAPHPVDAEFVEQLRSAFDALLTQTFLKHVRLVGTEPDSPFDAIYISALVPDVVESDAVRSLRSHQHVKDLSDSIQFADDWAD